MKRYTFRSMPWCMRGLETGKVRHSDSKSGLQMGCLTACALCLSDLTREQKHRLQPHVEALVSWPIGDIFSTEPAILVTRILVNCGWYFKINVPTTSSSL